MIKRHSLLALSGVVIVSSRVCWLCWLRPCLLEYLQMWSLLQSLYSVLYKLKLCPGPQLFMAGILVTTGGMQHRREGGSGEMVVVRSNAACTQHIFTYIVYCKA